MAPKYPPGFRVMARRCAECLMGKGKIVSDSRRRELLQECKAKDVPFLCHKGTIAGVEVACRGHYDATGGGQMGRIGQRLNMVVEIDPETLEVAHGASILPS